MIHQYRIIRFLLVLLTVICSIQSFAGVEPYQNQLKGTIKKGDSLIVKDEKFRNALFDWNEITNRTVKNFVSFQITYDTPVVLKKAFTCELDLKVEYFSTPDQAEPVSINSVKLKINFSPDSGATYKAKDVYSFSNGYWVKVTVNNISCPELGDSIPPVLQLTSQVVIDRQYVYHPEKSIDFSGNISAASAAGASTGSGARMMALSVAAVGGNPTNSSLSLTWPAISGAEEYDLEWAVFDQGTEKQPVLNQVLAGQTVAPDLLDALFRNNTTRITTAEQSFNITMVYNAQYIMVRMRQVHYTNGYRDEDDWDYKINGSSQYAIWTIPSWHEQNLNWQYSATFAEEGKKKEVVSYFDGTLRSRQMVTINNSDQVAVVQETVYDEFGRAAANILPAPTDDNTFHYYPNFNLNQNNASYDYRNLKGTIGVFCENTPDPLNNTAGAARYYSENNPFLNQSNTHYRKYNQYIPHANGYPISVTQYENDNTSRIRTQGGVGPVFQPGKTDRHVTKYYYGKPEAYELDRMFGNDVGYASHYLKNMVVDPNGQISVSYVNASGKTIATALTGDKPEGMGALPSKPEPEQKTLTLLRPSQFVFDATKLSLTAKTTYLSSVANASALFNYDIQKLIYTYQGSTFQICSNCYYNLTIRVTNDCGEPLLSTTQPVPIGAASGNCADTDPYPGSFNLTFGQPGEYNISFEFKLSNDVIDRYTDTYITQRQQKGDMRTQMDFILDDYLKNSDFSGCFNECTTCEAALGSQAQFSAAIKSKLTEYSVDQTARGADLDTWIAQTYNDLHSKCIALRASCMVSSCSKYEQEMLNDVSPGGQYALFGSDPFTPLEQDINVIYIHWRDVFPVEAPGTTDYEAEAIYDENGNKTSPYDANFTLEMLVKYWREDWAQKFLQWHPEKCKLEFCNANSDYIMWDDQVQQLINKASDIPNIPRTSGLQYSYTNGDWLLAGDPFFKPGAPGAGYYTNMQADLNQFSNRIMGITYSGATVKGLTQVIDYLMYCADPDGSTNSGPAGDNWNNCSPAPACRVPDKEWSQYKDSYFQLKQKYYQLVRSTTTCANICPVGTPYPVQSACASASDFTIERVTGGSGCGAGLQTVRISYGKGAAYRPMTIDLYYPIEYLAISKPLNVQFAIGESDKTICVPANVLVSSIKIKAVTCTGDPITNCIAGGISDQLTLPAGAQQLSSNKFQTTNNTGLVSTYTIVPGRADQPPADDTYCNGGTITRKNFYNCFKVYMPGSSIPVQYFNVWVIGCDKDLCANVDPITVEYQLDTYKFYDNGQYYYVKLQSGEGTSPCSSTPNYKPCVRFQVGPQLTPVTFFNASVSTCDACGSEGVVRFMTLPYPVSTNPDTYTLDDGTGNNIVLYPNTTPYSTPPNIPCSNYTTEWHSCVKVWWKFGSKTYFNTTVVHCLPDPCANAAQYNEYAQTSTDRYIDYGVDYYDFIAVLPNSDPNNRPNPGSYCTGNEYYADFVECAKFYVNGNLVNTYRNAWILTCVTYTGDQTFNAKPASSATPYALSVKPPNSVAYNYQSRIPGQSGKNEYTPLNNVWIATPCPEAYAYKKARFPEFNYTYSTSSQDLQNMQSESNQLIASQIQTNCEAQADKWMQQLDACLVLYPDKRDALRAKLIEVCEKGGDLDHPYGASTIPPGASGTPSFKQAILDVLGLPALTMVCNPWLLDEPHPYSPKQQSVSKTLSNTNADLCARIAQLRAEYSGSDAGFYDYLVNKYGAAMNLTSAQLTILLNSCNNCRYILAEDVPLPVFMEPGATGCITQADYNAAKAALAADMGGNLDVSHANYPDVLTNYLNHRWGFSMAYYRYQDYETKLQTSSSAILCNDPPYTEVAVDQYTCLKETEAAAIVNGEHDYDQYIAEEKRLFRLNYVNTCGLAQAHAQLTTQQQTYHYTLYYYDQAGNLVRTVPPEGVRLLSDAEIDLVEKYRSDNTVNDCSGVGMPASENKSVTFNSFSSVLQSSAAKSLELWLNSTDGSSTRQVRFVTPDNKYLYQTAIANGKLWAELYTLQPGTNGDISITLSNSAVADVSSITLQPWSHLFVQGSDFAGGQWDLYLDGRKLTLLSGSSAPSYPNAWEITAGYTLPAEDDGQLKQLRMYDRLATGDEIFANYSNPCQAPAGVLAVQSSPLIVWGRFNLPSACTGVAETRTINNRGALQVNDVTSTNNNRILSNVANNFTVELWTNPTETHEIDAQSQTDAGGTVGQKYAIFPTFGGQASDNRAGMGISVGTNGVSVYEHAADYMPALLVWQGYMSGWHHIAVVYNNGTPSLYIDGKWVKTGLRSTKATVNPSYNIGSSWYGVMKGGIDEVRIWNTVRTEDDISADYRQSISPASAGLVAYWPMSPENGADPYDIACSHIPVHLESNFSYTTSAAPVNDEVPVEYALQGVFPRHRTTSSYAFNSNNDLIQQKSPDGGLSYFWYDQLSRLIASQNEEQRTPHDNVNPNRYSYTIYEPTLGRILEVGEKSNGLTLPAPNYLDASAVNAFQASGSNAQITQTIYDIVPAAASGVQTGLLQNNLRKRVSAHFYKETATGPVSQASYYSYDLLGNVKTLWQQANGLALKRLDYEYDLVSGKTNMIRYQEGQNDQFYYSYTYDAENRLIEANSGTQVLQGTSKLTNGQLDAFYQYYLHGPLARTELGQNKVQGLDYAYTLQGWMSGINGNQLNPATEISNDGNSANNPIAKDVIAYTLRYYQNDYYPIGGTNATAFGMQYISQSGDITGNNLFNGNISHTTVALSNFRNSDPVGYTYHYDQLNRLKEMRYHPLSASTTTWNNSTKASDDAYKESITYDGNGNILTYVRNGANTAGMPLAMDALTYQYSRQTDPVNNQQYLVHDQLQQVKDAVADNNYSQSTNGTDDLDDQPDNSNYKYDKIGNLISDTKAGIQNITWTVYGKINSILKSDGSGIVYEYDADKNRIRKTVTTNGTPTTTWYTRDAKGNTLAIYTDKQAGQSGTWWQEQHLYGSSRLGMWTPGIDVASANGSGQWGLLGKKTYELSNHLGNVLATISDKKIAVSSASGNFDHYEADVTSAQDYYPFGMLMPGRKWSLNTYRYGFNGKENDDDVKGLGNQINYGARIEDPRIGRFLSVDPITKEYPELTPYQYASNSPIFNIDLDGLEGSSWWDRFLSDPVNTIMLGTTWDDLNAAAGDINNQIPAGAIINGSFQAITARDPVNLQPGASRIDGAGLAIIGAIFHVSAVHVTTPPVNSAAALEKQIAKNAATITEKAAGGAHKGNTEAVVDNTANKNTQAPQEAYNRTKHYGKTPTRADRKALNATSNDVVDHTTPLVKHYYEGDGNGGKPGHAMTPAERKTFATDRTKMKLQPKKDSNQQGAEMSKYSKAKKKEYGL